MADDDGELVGACGFQILALTGTGVSERRMTRADKADMRERPILSNLVVLPPYRRRGVGTRLVGEVEARAFEWGFDEMVLKVEADNAAAIGFYQELGYSVEARDAQAEKPCMSLFSRVRWERTTLVCMRKRGLQPLVTSA